jgi:hypothetical protein
MSSCFCADPSYINLFQNATLGALLVVAIQGMRAVELLEKVGVQLRAIKNELAIHNNLQTQGSTGDRGFAGHVHGYIKARIRETQPDKGKHYFFVYHPDTDWYPAFSELIEQEPLPENFCAQSDNLDALVAWMKIVRRRQIEKNETEGKDATFHILFPAYDHYILPESLKFPKELYPLRLECLRKGGAYVGLNLPNAPRNLLRGVHNLADEPQSQWLRIMATIATFYGAGAADALASTAIGEAIGTAAAAAIGIAAPWISVPLVFGLFGAGTVPWMWAVIGVDNADIWRPQTPRLLGQPRDRSVGQVDEQVLQQS